MDQHFFVVLEPRLSTLLFCRGNEVSFPVQKTIFLNELIFKTRQSTCNLKYQSLMSARIKMSRSSFSSFFTSFSDALFLITTANLLFRRLKNQKTFHPINLLYFLSEVYVSRLLLALRS